MPVIQFSPPLLIGVVVYYYNTSSGQISAQANPERKSVGKGKRDQKSARKKKTLLEEREKKGSMIRAWEKEKKWK